MGVLDDDTATVTPIAKLRERVRDVERDNETTTKSLKAGNAKFARLTSAMLTVGLTFAGAVLAGMFWGGRVEAKLEATREILQEVRAELRELRVELRARPPELAR